MLCLYFLEYYTNNSIKYLFVDRKMSHCKYYIMILFYKIMQFYCYSVKHIVD